MGLIVQIECSGIKLTLTSKFKGGICKNSIIILENEKLFMSSTFMETICFELLMGIHNEAYQIPCSWFQVWRVNCIDYGLYLF